MMDLLKNLGEGGSEQVRYGSQASYEPLSIPVERILASLRFDSKEKTE